ncbi:unnamed protein product [Schistosoma rodhaini]|uniref:Cadherin domain-containing protein n=1 Tax=Schistosoma rodhaini TaxID=6188 RepID=A0AA85G1I8_9TREM|nr:unnamed protein product [Schistosoma rodhaini]
MNHYNDLRILLFSLKILLLLLIPNCISLIQNINSPIDHEYYIEEEIPIGTIIGNIMDDLIMKFIDFGLTKFSHKLNSPINDNDHLYSLMIMNFADPYVNLFDIKLDGRIILSRRLDRDQICPKQQHTDSPLINIDSTQFSSIYTSTHRQNILQTEKISCFIILQIGLFIHQKDGIINKVNTKVNNKKQIRLFHIRINIQDINDNAPYWQGHLQRFRITFLDGDPVGSRRNIPPAMDNDEGINGHITYELSPVNSFDKSHIPFSLLEDSIDGLHLYATKQIDREEQSQYKLVLKATDGSYSSSSFTLSALSNESTVKRFTSTLYVDIFIEDVNDNTPQFTQPIFTTSMPIAETTPVGSTVLLLNATDLDSGINGIFHFSFSKDHYWQPAEKIARHYFDIRPNGQIIVKQPLNVDKLDQINSHINHNNNKIVLPNIRSAYQLKDDIDENINKGANVQFRFRAVVEDEATRPYTRSSEATVIILVTDENDEPPVISLLPNPELISSNALDAVTTSNSFSYFWVFENQPVGTTVATVQAYDPDFGGQDQVECNLKDSNFSLIRITSQTQPEFDRNTEVNLLTEYHLITARILDRESTSHQVVTIVCSDMVGHYTERNITVRILDQNDNRPKFSHEILYLQVDENAPYGTQVRQQSQKVNRGHFNNVHQTGSLQGLLASDLDIGINSQMTFFLLEDGINSTKFKIDSHTGIITTMDIFDREVKEKYTLIALAVDHGNPPLTGTSTVQITINDLNDNGPVFSTNNYTFHLQENQARSTIVGQVNATDVDSSAYGPLEYSFANDPDSVNFTIDKITGIIRNRQSLDREEKSQYIFRVLVKDTKIRPSEFNSISINKLNSKSIQYTGTSTVTVIVDDINDNWPVFVSPNSTANTLAIALDQKITGYKLAYIQAEDKDEGNNGTITYNILTGNNYGLFGLDSTSGLLYLSSSFSDNNKLSDHNNELYDSSNTSNLPTNDEFNGLLHKSSIHILTLEACDQGQDPKPRCTLYNNLKIMIQNNKEKDVHTLESKQSQYNSINQFINAPGLTSAETVLSSAFKQNHPNHIQNNFNSIQEFNNDNLYQKATGLAYGNLLMSKQNHKLSSYTTNDIMITCLSIIFALVLIATLILVCLVRRRVVSFKNQTKKPANQVKNEPIHHWKNQTVTPTSSMKNYNIASPGHGQFMSSINENPLSINHNAELLSKSTISNKNNNNNHDHNYDVNFVSIQNSLNNSIISPDESGSPRSIYQFITTSSSIQATQTTPTVVKTITTDYKQYGCNTREINYKFNQLNSPENRDDHDRANVSMVFQKVNEHNISMNKLDDYQTLDYLGLVSPTILNKQSVYHKNHGLVTYSPHIMNMPKLVSLPSGGLTTFNHQNAIHTENKQLFTSIHYNPNLDNSSYQITHFHSQSQPQPMSNRYTTLPTFSNNNQTICDLNSTFIPACNQHPNNVTTNNKNSNIMLPYLMMSTSNVNLNNIHYPSKTGKHPTQSHTYYDIRQPDLKPNIPVMYKSKSQQLSTAIKYHVPTNSKIKDDGFINSSKILKNEKYFSHTTENIDEASINNIDNNSVVRTDLTSSWNETGIWTPEESNTPLEKWVELSEQNSQNNNNNSFTTIVPSTMKSNNTITATSNRIIDVTNSADKNFKSNTNMVCENLFPHIGRRPKLADSGKYMSAALRESSFV